MTATEFNSAARSDSLDESLVSRRAPSRLNGQSISVSVDEEWCVVEGVNDLAELLGVRGEAIDGNPIGRLIHPDDLAVSPSRVWRSGHAVVLKFRQHGSDYLRLAVGIRRAQRGWSLTLTKIEAEVLQFRRSADSAS